MKKSTLCPALVAVFALCVLCFGQSSVNNPAYNPYARFVIPVQQRPEFAGSVTNYATNTVYDVSGWATNLQTLASAETVTNIYPQLASVEVVTTNTIAQKNPATEPVCDFLLLAVKEGPDGKQVVWSFKSWEDAPE